MSDHFSGPRAIAGPAGDITDLYAFPSPERPGHLVLVLDVLPNATSDSHFSEAIVCRFRLRPVTIGGVGPAAAFPFAGEDQELVFSCHFEAPRQGGAGMAPVQEGWCVTPSGDTTRFRVNDEKGASERRSSRICGPQSGTIFPRSAGPHRVTKDWAACLQRGRHQCRGRFQRSKHCRRG